MILFPPAASSHNTSPVASFLPSPVWCLMIFLLLFLRYLGKQYTFLSYPSQRSRVPLALLCNRRPPSAACIHLGNQNGPSNSGVSCENPRSQHYGSHPPPAPRPQILLFFVPFILLFPHYIGISPLYNAVRCHPGFPRPSSTYPLGSLRPPRDQTKPSDSGSGGCKKYNQNPRGDLPSRHGEMA